MESSSLTTIGTQKMTGVGLALGLAAAVITAAGTWVQFGQTLGLLTGVLGVAGTLKWYRNRGNPMFLIEHEQLVQVCGGWKKRYPWSKMRRPVRLVRKHFTDCLEVRQLEAPPLLIPVGELTVEERERLREIVVEIVCGPSASVGEDRLEERVFAGEEVGSP